MLIIQNIWNLITAILYLAFFQKNLKHITEKRQEHVLAVVVIAGFMSVVIVFALYELYPVSIAWVASYSELTFNIFVVGLVEEVGKFLAFLFVVHTVGNLKEPQDGAIFGAVVGLTFGFVENIIYFNRYDSWFLMIRPIISTGGHAIYAAISGGIYSQTLYANRTDNDPGATRNALIGIPLVAILHGAYNATTHVFGFAILIKIAGFLFAIHLFRKLVELSPYRIYSLSEARGAIPAIKRGLVFNKWSPTLNRNLGIYLMHTGAFRDAARHLRRSVPRSKDPRRAQFLAAACETTFLTNYHAKRVLRIAWARLDDDQRIKYLEQLKTLLGNDNEIVGTVQEFVAGAFHPRKVRKASEIAREAKIRRMARKRSGIRYV